MTRKETIDAIKHQKKHAEKFFYQKNKKECIQFACKNFFWKLPDGNSRKCKPEDAEELYNDACTLFIQNIIRGRVVNLEVKISTYLITTMKYSWFNKARAMKAKPPKVKIEESEETKESRRVQVRQAINLLGQKCREIMTYRYILGWEDYEDIARATGKNNGAVIRNLISRCRKRFREQYMQLAKLSDH